MGICNSVTRFFCLLTSSLPVSSSSFTVKYIETHTAVSTVLIWQYRVEYKRMILLANTGIGITVNIFGIKQKEKKVTFLTT